MCCIFFFYGAAVQRAPWSPHSLIRFLDHTQRRTTVGRIPLDEWSARRRDLYLTKHNTHNRQTSISPAGFELTISADERPQTHALDRAAAGTSNYDSQESLLLLDSCSCYNCHYFYFIPSYRKLSIYVRLSRTPPPFSCAVFLFQSLILQCTRGYFMMPLAVGSPPFKLTCLGSKWFISIDNLF